MRRFPLILAGLAGLLLVSELGCRGWLALRGHGVTYAAVLAEHREGLDGMRLTAGANDAADPSEPLPGAISHPFLGWSDAATLEDWPKQTHYFTRTVADEIFDVVFVGGGLAQQLAEESGPQLRMAFVATPGNADLKLRLVYIGHPHHKQPQQVNAVAFALAQGWKPDLVINVDGHNELALADANHARGAHPLYPSIDHWEHMDQSQGATGEANDFLLDAYAARRRVKQSLARLESSPLARSALVFGRAAASLESSLDDYRASMERFEGHDSTRNRPGVFGPECELDFQARVELVVDQWSRSSAMLQAVCAAHSVDYLHVLGPSRLEGDLDGPVARAVRAGLPLMRARQPELEGLGVRFLDASRLFEGARAEAFTAPDRLSREARQLLCDRIVAYHVEGGRLEGDR